MDKILFAAVVYGSLILHGCSPSIDEQLTDIERTKKWCQEFERRYKALTLPTPPSDSISLKISECKAAGAWEISK